MTFSDLLNLIGYSKQPRNIRETLVSAAGGFFGIFGILIISFWLLDPKVAVLIVPSMGATAVLLFAAPHAQFSEPWNVIAGHVFSAIIGVTCWQLIPNFTVAASVSVGLAIGVMVATRSIHPPGGATALAAVIGSEKLHSLEYSYVYLPILLNVITILLVAIAFNALFKWRLYPAHIHKKKQAIETVASTDRYEPINHEDFVFALSQIETYADIDEADLLKIYSIATKRHLEDYNSQYVNS